MIADTPSLGLIIGVPLVVLIALVCIAVIVYGAFFESYDPAFSIVGGVVCLLITLVVTGLCLWPLKGDYHFWREKSGVVQKISKRFVGTDNGTEQKFVVVLNGDPYGIPDTRAALLKVGDRLSLRCKKTYEWGVSESQNGWDCKWNGVGR